MTYLDDRPDTPDAALAELLAGNARFVSGTRVHPNQDAEHRATIAQVQKPFAVVFGCSDSRLAAEMIFDRGLGDLFVVRTAGHIIGPEVIASIEYGVTVLGAVLVVVLGHDSCGAILATQAALGGNRPADGHLDAIIDRVTPSLELAHEQQITDQDQIGDVHVQYTVAALAEHARAVRASVADGKCAVVGMSYRLADSRITVLNDGATIGS